MPWPEIFKLVAYLVWPFLLLGLYYLVNNRKRIVQLLKKNVNNETD